MRNDNVRCAFESTSRVHAISLLRVVDLQHVVNEQREAWNHTLIPMK